MAGVVLVPPRYQFLDGNANPLANGKVDVYLAGTTTRTPTWQDQAQTTLNTNPIILDANGSCTMVVDDSLTYKLVVKNSANVEQTHAGGDNIVGGTTRLAQMSFTQAGSGAVTRGAQDKMRDIVSPKDFGAAGDGVADDTAEFQAAITYASNTATLDGGGKTYKVTSPLTVTADGHKWRDINILYTGASTSAAITFATGGDTYLRSSVQNVKLTGSGTSALIGIRTRKLLDGGWSNVYISGFTAAGAIGMTMEGSTSNRFFNCHIDSCYSGLKTLNFLNSNGTTYVPANENKFFGCGFTNLTAYGVYLPGDAAAGGALESTGNTNSFHACWFEDNGGVNLWIENSANTLASDCRFEDGTGYNVQISPTMGPSVRRQTRLIDCNFIGLHSPTAHFLNDTNAFGTQLSGCQFSGGGVTPWVDSGTGTILFNNNSDGGTTFDNSVANFSSLTSTAGTHQQATVNNLKLTSRANSNNWTDVTVTANAITFSTTLAKCATAGTTISTINGGSSGDILMIKGAVSAGSGTTLIAGGNIRLPSGLSPELTTFTVATLINDGFSRWLLVSFSNNV